MRLFPCLQFSAALLAGLLAGMTSTHAQAQQPHNMADMQAVLPPEQLPVPIKMQGIGNSHIAIKATPEAQAWFDQGLNLLHDFWEYESQKAFEQGIRVDRDCAMCWWGLAQAEGFRHSDAKAYGKKALAEAVRLKGRAGASGRLYIEAAQAEEDAKDDDQEPGNRNLSQAGQEVSPRYPGAYLPGGVGRRRLRRCRRAQGGQKECISILEGVLKDAPHDSAANHYWIHAIEPGNHPERALNSAALLASLAPSSGHMVHMPGHIYYRVGSYSEAERWFTASTNCRRDIHARAARESR